MDRDGTVTVCDDHDGQWLPWVGNLRLAPVVSRSETDLGKRKVRPGQRIDSWTASYLIRQQPDRELWIAVYHETGTLAFVYPLL